MDQAFRNLIKLGLSEEEVSQRLSAIPAQLINELSVGKIEEKRFADFVVYNSKHELVDIFIDGDKV